VPSSAAAPAFFGLADVDLGHSLGALSAGAAAGAALATYLQHRWHKRTSWEGSVEYATGRILRKVETPFAAHPESRPIVGVAEEHWVERDARVTETVRDLLFRAAGRGGHCRRDRLRQDVDGEDGGARGQPQRRRLCRPEDREAGRRRPEGLCEHV
jgi:hypothetical protein